ncbi:hypothetical protein NQZ68_012920 [Dissostichus eleginoides]|nr:hypothetical protein NQZ68_012920 [Dissostichus eleginoides]
MTGQAPTAQGCGKLPCLNARLQLYPDPSGEETFLRHHQLSLMNHLSNTYIHDRSAMFGTTANKSDRCH